MERANRLFTDQEAIDLLKEGTGLSPFAIRNPKAKCTFYYLNAPCYSELGTTVYIKGCDTVWAKIRPGRKKEEDELFWSIVLSKELSPWRGILNQCEIFYGGNGLPHTIRIDVDQNTSSKLLVNFLIATRIPYEHGNILKRLVDALNAGFHPQQALYLFFVFGDKALSSGGGHFPFTPDEGIDWIKFRDGIPACGRAKLQKGSSYYPSDEIWQGEMPILRYVETKGRQSEDYKGAFPKFYRMRENSFDQQPKIPLFKDTLELVSRSKNQLLPMEGH